MSTSEPVDRSRIEKHVEEILAKTPSWLSNRRPNPNIIARRRLEEPDNPRWWEPLPEGASLEEIIADNDKYFAALDQERLEAIGGAARPALPRSGDTLRVYEVPVFAVVRVTKLGSFNAIDDDTDLLGETVIMWTQGIENTERFAEARWVRGVLTPNNAKLWADGELAWLSSDGEVELIDPPTYIGQPKDYIPEVASVELPERDHVEDWPYLLWNSEPLWTALRGLNGPDQAIETILCALTVAPKTLWPFLEAGLKDQHKELVQEGYSGEEMPWRDQNEPRWDNYAWGWYDPDDDD